LRDAQRERSKTVLNPISKVDYNAVQIVDCLGGIFIGAFVWFLIIHYEAPMTAWVYSGSYQVPLVVISVTLFLVSVHPEPVDDCPCFEDAIASLAVSMGLIVGAWQINASGIELGNFTVGSPEGNLLIWAGGSLAKIALGIGAIFLWR
jgi:dihydrosphingosine 1-phosphate phosphatase